MHISFTIVHKTFVHQFTVSSHTLDTDILFTIDDNLI